MLGTTMKTGLLLLGGALLAATIPTAFAAMPVPVPQEAEAPATTQPVTSQVLALALPDGAQKAASAGELAPFQQVLQQVARNNNGTISRSEALLWTGDAAKTVVNDMNARMKTAGYTFAVMESFDAEPGKVTPLAAMRGSKADSVIGLWIETKDDRTLLLWGRYTPNTAAKTAPAKVTPPKNVAATPRKTTPKKVAATPRKRPAESTADRRAKALKAYQDYQYVKLMGPISGPMYRSTKW